MGVAALPPPSSPKLLNKVVQMDVQYTWILRKGLNCRQLRLLIYWSFIGQFVQPVGGEGDGVQRYFIPLQVTLC